jgi:hypothetical protein
MLSGSVPYSASYPASEHGGTISGHANWSEEVTITIQVDTSSFDHSVSTIKHHIDGLTTAVVATEAAQIAERVRSADEIGQSVTSGFFQLIGSEIAQQMVALKSLAVPQAQRYEERLPANQAEHATGLSPHHGQVRSHIQGVGSRVGEADYQP